MEKRSAGILLHITSLPSEYGIGTLGKEAYKFVDFLKKSGETYWQILPVGPTGYGDSPYQSFSAFAGNPYFIDFDMLSRDGLLSKDEYSNEYWGDSPSKVDFGAIYENKNKILSIAASRMNENNGYADFKNENSFWLDDFALYTAIKKSLGGIALSEWDDNLRLKDENAIREIKEKLSNEIEEVKKIQYLFYVQWNNLKEYANKNNIKIIGDIPIYVSADSADVFSCPEIFLLDKEKRPIEVAGCPPDAFSDDGQLWGNPLYDWSYLEKTGYDWWCRRLSHSSKLFDVIRIDHFRGFAAFYCIKAGEKTAKNGVWRKGPGLSLFKALKEKVGKIDIIAEDLGTIDEGVRKLLKSTGYPGMKVLQFAFDPDTESDYMPHNHSENYVVYTGTHDNDTLRGWIETMNKKEYEYVKDYMRLSKEEGENWGIIKTALASPSKLVMIPIQDFINAGSEARMNTPSTFGGNWTWRIDGSCINDWIAGIIYKCNKVYRRI